MLGFGWHFPATSCPDVARAGLRRNNEFGGSGALFEEKKMHKWHIFLLQPEQL